MKTITFLIFILLISGFCQYMMAQKPVSVSHLCEQLKLQYPEKGFISAQPASRWEESLITGNGTLGALVLGNPGKDIIILSHEKLFMPQYPPTKAPDLKKYLKEIRELTLNGEGEKAAEIAIQAGKEAGIEDLIWTDPLVPACQLEVQSENDEPVLLRARTVNYQTGEATSAWKTKSGVFHQNLFASRTDGVVVFRLRSRDGAKLNFRFRLNQLPLPEGENEEEMDFKPQELISNVTIKVSEKYMVYSTVFKKQWPGSLKGYNTTANLFAKGGEITTTEDWVSVNNADEITIISSIKLFYDLPVEKDPLKITVTPDYPKLLASHSKIHQEMFDRFNIRIGSEKDQELTAEEILARSHPGSLTNNLVNQLSQAARYGLVSSTGELPPTLQGIWGGTWLPAWSGDFTHNGNVPSAIASGYNTNFIEVMDAYTGYMFSMYDDFKDNARDVYGFDGIFCLSRSSSSGKTYHYLTEYPHMYWFAGAAWFSQFFYDYWQYTGDVEFLKKKTIPFMFEALNFYKDLLVKDESSCYMFIPSYSPEVGPIGYHPVVINATMDIAAFRLLLNNLISLVDNGWIEADYKKEYLEILNNLPEYEIDENGELKEWIYPGLKNNNEHRHASHLLPLFYEVDPEFEKNPELKKAAVQAIESRMKYRRGKNGAEMAFGLVQKGLAAAHLNDRDHAYECVDWLCNSYWSPAFTSYHDPGEIFNVDISGGLPAVVTEMIIQSSMEEIILLPALPRQWSEGTIKGVRARGGFVVDMEWKDSKPVKVNVKSLLGNKSVLIYKDQVSNISLSEGESKTWEF